MRTSFRSAAIILILLVIAGLLAACIPAAPAATAVPEQDIASEEQPAVKQEQDETPAQSASQTSDAGPHSTATATVTASPTEQPSTNPLSGLAVDDPDSLVLPPALVPISNFPPSVRPQSGLSYTPLVFEFFVGEGMTRLLAYFYGDLPDTDGPETEIGPVHSGRLPDEHLRQLYQGFLVISGASANVARNLYHYTSLVSKSDAQIGNLMVTSRELHTIALDEKGKLDEMGSTGMLHEADIPPGGKKAESFWLMYSYPNQIIWRYDPAIGAYQRYQDKGDAVTFERLDDRLTGEALAFENVIIFFAEHKAIYASLIDLEFTFYDREPALLLRDGQLYKIYWSTRNTPEELASGKTKPIRFMDYDGDLFPLKPGQTWVQIVQPGAPYWEAIDSQIYFDRVSKKQTGSGHWSMVFEPPGAILDTPE